MLPKEDERVVITFTTPNERKVEVEGCIQRITEDATVSSGFGVSLSSFGDDYLVVVEDFLKSKDREDFLKAKDRRAGSTTGDT